MAPARMHRLTAAAATAAAARDAPSYWLILGERVLRQFLATPLLGRGPRFAPWLREQAQGSPAMFCMRMLL